MQLIIKMSVFFTDDDQPRAKRKWGKRRNVIEDSSGTFSVTCIFHEVRDFMENACHSCTHLPMIIIIYINL